ncbi:hypothetical protein [Streptomyces sp. NPDC091212]|uniref:hypothetical protein n=1 Tax=Streptomyces sp. NPDC091212 TaxID=3155191 RepID=UPI003435A9AA
MAEHNADREPQPIDEDAAWAAIVAGYGEEPADPPGAKPFKSVEDLALLEGERNSERKPPEKEPKDLAKDPGKDLVKDPEKAAEGAERPAPPEGERTADPGPAASGSAVSAPGVSDTAASASDGTASGTAEDTDAAGPDAPKAALGGSVVFAPGVGGPRDYRLAEPSEKDFDEGDEGHFVPPEPPPLPESDATTRFAWLAVVGGPVLMLVAVLLQWEMTWWLTTVCIGGFLGGFATLVARMHEDDDESDDPGRGAVV